MARVGLHAYMWIDEWTKEKGDHAIRSTAEAGCDLIEIPLYTPEAFDPEAHKALLRATGLEVSGGVVLPEWAHMPEHPEEAFRYLVGILDRLEAVGGSRMVGCTCYALGKFTGVAPTDSERQVVVDTLGRVALEAKKRGIRVALEVLNRYETYLYNTLADARETILAIGADNIDLQPDTYHINIEEAGFCEPLVKCADVIGYMHISESNRATLGAGNVDWEGVFRGLSLAKYTGPLVMEIFTQPCPDLAAATKIWRLPSGSPHEIATHSVEFVRKYAEKYCL